MAMSHATAGRIGAHISWSRTEDRAARTEPARTKFLARFENEVDPDGLLPADERLQRALHARRAYMQRLAVKSARSRSLAAGSPRSGRPEASPVVGTPWDNLSGDAA